MNSLSDERRLVGRMLHALGEEHCAVRRAREEDYLLACALPMRAPESVCGAFAAMAQSEGFRVCVQEKWILLDRPVGEDEPPETEEGDGEAAALLSVLARHRTEPADPTMIRRLLKAEDEGWQQLEAVCEELHGDFAGRLRDGRMLPDLNKLLGWILARRYCNAN